MAQTLLVNYANRVFTRSQQLNCESGVRRGRFDQAIAYGPDDIDLEFRRRNSHILDQERGNGYWLWKPYFIRRTLDQLANGDFLFYCDAGAIFLDPIAPLLELCIHSGQDILSFELDHREGTWTKRDAFVLLDCDQPQYVDSLQRLASFSLWLNSEEARQFADRWLLMAQDERILTDTTNTMGLPNYAGFREHRHDQSVFSLLAKKCGLKAWRDPSQWGNAARERHPDSTYGQLILHTRKRNR
jgi:hypothetical protein